MEETNRGSEWNKWDLHIHTPASFFWKGSKKLKDMSDGEKEVEIKNFITKINESDVLVFCLMDYWTFDWYLELQKYKENNPDELKKTVLPGMELRIECPVDYRLNIHCILSDKLSRQDLIDFKSELYIRSIDKKLSDHSIIKFAQSLDKSKAKKHGYNDPLTLTNSELLQLGSKTAEVTKDSLSKAFEQIPAQTGFVILPYDTSDGLLNLKWEDHPHDDNYFMQSSHIFETREQDNIDLISGIRTLKNDKIFENFFKTLGNKAKPCIAGSDAHRYKDYGVFPSNQKTWIKAEPTFEGLKQIIYEPDQRVKIQPNEPDFKEDKLIIDEVQYFSSNNLFSPEKIKFNKNLNVIIGGKSSGKSILLYNIAATLETNGEVTSITNDKYDFRKEDQNFNFEVKSFSGISQKLFDDKENSIIPNIKYIPQNYLTKLAEPKANKEGAELLKYVRGLLLEDEKYKIYYQDFLNTVKSNDKKREDLIDSYFATKDNIKTKYKELKGKGNEEVLTKSIASNLVKISELKRGIGLTPEEIATYNSEKVKLENVESDRIKIVNDYRKVSNFNRDILNTLKELKNKKDLNEKSLETESIKSLFTKTFSFLDVAISELDLFTESIRPEKNILINDSLFKTLLLTNKKEKARLEKVLEPLIKNDKVKHQIAEIDKIVTADKQKLQAINQLKTEINNSKEELEKNKVKLFELYTDNSGEYPKIISTLYERTKLLEEQNLEIIGTQKFNARKFIKSLYDVSDGRSFPEKEYSILQRKNDLIDFKNTVELVEIKKIFEAIVEDEDYVLSTKTNTKNAVKILLDDYFVDYWETEFDGDKMGEMSTGKASFVILMLIVGLSNSKAPILIDQPEDNLDNRSITKDLVEYLRDKKTERQIILVTHNPNIVVNADAENVIVANQKGQNDKETSSIYKFDYINGAIENTIEFDENEKDLLKSMGIREHIAEIVEGGKEAFKKREVKYGF